MASESSVIVKMRLLGAAAFRRDADRSSRSLGGMGRRAGITGRAFGGLTSTARTLAASLGLVAGAGGALMFARSSFDAYRDFNAAMTESVAIMGDISGPMRKRMEETARQVGRTTKFSATDAARAYFYLASAGLDARRSLEAMPRVAAFAQAGQFDLAKATDLLTDAQSALGLSSKNAPRNLQNLNRVADVFVKANTLANTSVEQVSEALTNKAGGALRVLHKDVEEGVAVLAAFADQGVKGAQAGESLNIVLRDLQTAARKHADEFKRHGVAVYTEGGKMRNVADIIGDLEGALEGMTDKQATATLASLGFQDKSVSQIKLLLGTSERIRAYERELRRAAGTTDTVAKKQLSGMEGALIRLRGAWHDIKITIGEKLAPAVASGAEWFARLTDEMRRGEGTGGRFARTMRTTGRFLGDVWDVIRRVATFTAHLIAQFERGEPTAVALGTATASIAAGLVAMNRTAKVLTFIKALREGQIGLNLAMYANPVVLIVGGLIALGVAAFIAYRKIGWFRRGVDAAFRWMRRSAASVIEWLKANWPLVVGVLTGPVGIAVVMVIRHWGTLRGAATSTIAWIKGRWDAFLGFWRGLPGRMKSSAGDMWGFMRRGFRNALNAIIDMWNRLEIPGFTVKGPGPLPDVHFPAIQFPDLPRLARGGVAHGLTIINERGPEVLDLPGGTRVHTAPVSRRMAAAAAPMAPRRILGVAPIYLNIDGRTMHRELVRLERADEERR